MSHPYENLSESQYWKTAIAGKHQMNYLDVYRAKFPIHQHDRIMVAGSCFAQHVRRHLDANGYTVLDGELAPTELPPDVSRQHGYGVYSARYGNIYSARQLLQLLQDALAREVRAGDFWAKDGRVVDALRPGIDPDGYDDLDEAMDLRRHHLSIVRDVLSNTDVLIFTLGLTEAWVNIGSGTVYPTCPGVMAGTFDPEQTAFVNFGYLEIYQDLVQVRKVMKELNPDLRLLLTVSPVPLTATATDQHVLLATTYSKSVLRAVCGALVQEFSDVDYFPSYELIASPPVRGIFFEPNQRTVASHGVTHVMGVFLRAHLGQIGLANVVDHETAPVASSFEAPKGSDELDCEEALLEAFSK